MPSICAQNLLDTYSAALLQRLPKTIHGQTSASPPLVGQDWYIRVAEEEELVRAYSYSHRGWDIIIMGIRGHVPLLQSISSVCLLRSPKSKTWREG